MNSPGFERRAAVPDDPIPLELDDTQASVISLDNDSSAAVLGAPGTGKTTTMIEAIAERIEVRGWDASSVLALTTSRASATRLRDAIALRLARPTSGPLARTVNSLAFEVVRDAARAAGSPPFRLMTGGEQDAELADLLEGHLAESIGPSWPEALGPEVRSLRRFRTELRELMMRATEYDVSTDRLRELGAEHDRPEWVAAAFVMDELQQVLALTGESRVDAAELARFAVSAIGSASPGRLVESLRAVFVDDLHEATESTLAILRALSQRNVAIVAFGDPDVAANAFRGGEPDALGRLGTVLGRPDTRTITLSTGYRQGQRLREFTSSVTARIGTAAAGTQRAAHAAGDDDDVPLARIEATSPAREWAAVARVLRERHLEHGVPFSQMAVVVRSGSHVPGIARSLALAEVPARTAVGGTALRDDGAARALLTLVAVGIDRELTPEVATELLLGPFGGLDRLALRRLRLALRAEELAGGGSRPADELLVEGLSAPGRFITIDHRVARQAERLAATLSALRASDGSIEELLWLAWERSGLARTWYDQAIGGGLVAAEANRNLDGIVALFTAAKRFAERRPDDPPSVFLADVLDADVPEDTLSPQAADESVLVTTPSGTVGLEFDTVIIAALQDGAWPNLKLRGSLLAPQQLVRAVTHIDETGLDERRQVLGDELRMFALAVSRARRRVVLAAVANDDESSSVFFGLLPADTPVIDSSTAAAPLSLRGMTGYLRRRLVDAKAGEAVAAAAAASLASLAAEGVAGANPTDWHGLLDRSTTAPLFEGQKVPVSPSTLERIATSPLDWFLQLVAGGDSGVVANVGTIIHWAMETVDDPTSESLWAAVESRWSELLFDAPWLGERQKQIARGLTGALAEYLGDFAREGKALVGAESRFALEVDNAEVRGSIDRVERAKDGSVVIVDLKTGNPVPRAEVAEHPQLAAYQLAYAEGVLDDALAPHGGHAPGGAKLLFVKKGVRGKLYQEAVQPPLDAEQLEAFRERIRRATALIAAAEFDGVAELDVYRMTDAGRWMLNRVKAVSSD